MQKQSWCAGYKQGDDTEKCVFSPANPGDAAYPRGGKCVFCCPDRMLAAVEDSRKKHRITEALNNFKEKNIDIYQRALGRLRSNLSTELFKKAATPKNHCIGVGDQLCTRSYINDGGPVRARKGKLCAGCAQEEEETEKAKRDAETAEAAEGASAGCGGGVASATTGAPGGAATAESAPAPPSHATLDEASLLASGESAYSCCRCCRPSCSCRAASAAAPAAGAPPSGAPSAMEVDAATSTPGEQPRQLVAASIPRERHPVATAVAGLPSEPAPPAPAAKRRRGPPAPAARSPGTSAVGETDAESDKDVSEDGEGGVSSEPISVVESQGEGCEAAALAAEAAAAAEPPAAEAAAPAAAAAAPPAAAAAAPPAAAAAAAAEAQASDPRPPFDAASAPPFKCFYPSAAAPAAGAPPSGAPSAMEVDAATSTPGEQPRQLVAASIPRERHPVATAVAGLPSEPAPPAPAAKRRRGPPAPAARSPGTSAVGETDAESDKDVSEDGEGGVSSEPISVVESQGEGCEAAALAAEAAAAAEPPAAEAAAPAAAAAAPPAAAAAAPPAAAAAAAAEAQASDPRPPFDAASSPPFKCFYLDCTATQNTYLGLMRRLKAKHCKVVSDFDGTFFADQVRAQKAEENDSRIARAAESAEAAAGASAAGASGAAPPARPATQARARVSQRAAAAGVVSKVKQELAEEENAEEGKMNAPVGRLQLLPRPPPQIFVHADQPKRKQLTLEQTIGFSRSLATDEKQRPAAAGEPPVAAREPHVKVCQDDQASIWAYQSRQRHGSKHFPLTEKAMKFLVSEYRARYGAATTAPNNTDMTEIIAKGQMEEVKCLGEEVVVDQVRNFYRQFLKLAAARSSHPAPRTA